VLTCGGGANNLAWNKIREHCLKSRVTKATQQEASFGVALLAKRASS